MSSLLSQQFDRWAEHEILLFTHTHLMSYVLYIYSITCAFVTLFKAVMIKLIR